MMRVGYVLKRYPRYSETFIVNEILAHEAAGVVIDIFSLRYPNDTHFQDIIAKVRAPVTYVPSEAVSAADLWQVVDQSTMMFPNLAMMLDAARARDVADVYQAILLAREVRLRRLQHLHSHFASVATSVTRLAALLAGVPYTFTAHAKDIFHDEVSAEDVRRKIRDAAAAVTICDYNLSYLRNTFPTEEARITRIYNGLDLSQYAYADPAGRAPIIAAVGRLVEKKGFSNVIDACGVLQRRGLACECTIVGSGEQEPALAAQIDRLKLHDRVRLAGPRPQGEVKEIIQRAAVLAAPCVVGSDGNQDGLPTVLLEAMALGTPCVSTAVAGIPEVVRDEVTGLIVPQHDAHALADALERLLTDAQLRVRLARNARRLVEIDFDIRKNAASLQQLFAGAHAPLQSPVAGSVR